MLALFIFCFCFAYLYVFDIIVSNARASQLGNVGGDCRERIEFCQLLELQHETQGSSF